MASQSSKFPRNDGEGDFLVGFQPAKKLALSCPHPSPNILNLTTLMNSATGICSSLRGNNKGFSELNWNISDSNWSCQILNKISIMIFKIYFSESPYVTLHRSSEAVHFSLGYHYFPGSVILLNCLGFLRS